MKQKNAPERIDYPGLTSHPRAYNARSSRFVRLLSFDPGGTTGWSHMTLPAQNKSMDTLASMDFRQILNISQWKHGQIDCEDENAGIFALERLLDDNWTSAIITEMFILQAGRSEKSRALLTPERLNSHIEYWAWKMAKPIFKQTAGMAKPAMRDDRLKAFECYTSEGGLQHARDADRHLLFFLKRVMGKSPKAGKMRNEAWPHIYNEKGDLKSGLPN